MVVGARRPSLRADHIDVGACFFDGFLRLGELDLLASRGSEQDRDLAAVQRLASHDRSFR